MDFMYNAKLKLCIRHKRSFVMSMNSGELIFSKSDLKLDYYVL